MDKLENYDIKVNAFNTIRLLAALQVFFGHVQPALQIGTLNYLIP